MSNRTVAIFGVFDGLHDGHLHFIKQARKLGDVLVAIVARDNEVNRIKSKFPKKSEEDRIKDLLEVKDIDRVVLGDIYPDTYNTINEINPDIIFLGYDQLELFKSIKNAIKNGTIKNIEVKMGDSYKPEEFKSSLLNKI